MLVWYLHVNLLEAHWLPGIRWNVYGREGDFTGLYYFWKTHANWSHWENIDNQCPRGIQACSRLLCILLRLRPGNGPVGPSDLQWANIWTLPFVVHVSQRGPEIMLRPSALDFLVIPTYSLIPHFALVTWGREGRGICHDHHWVNVLETQHWNPAACRSSFLSNAETFL